MKMFKLKIKEKFIPSIYNGLKKHEYRLANEVRKQIKVGDLLVLISNQNNKNYVKVRVKSIAIYKTWEEALKQHWETDFENLFDSFETALKECYKFYRREDVEKYGIVVFEIEPYVVDLKHLNVLLDTNIVIHRESSNNTAAEVMRLFKTINKLKATPMILDDVVKEISKYKDKNVVQNILSKLRSYQWISSSNNEIDPEFENAMSKYPNDENSKIDNNYLYQVFSNKVDVLITEDKGILNKAKDLYLDDSVFSTIGFLKYIENHFPSLIDYKVLSIKLEKMADIDLNNPFFDTLKADYGGYQFIQWFEKKAKEDAEAYVFSKDAQIHGFLYLKIEDKDEDYNDITPVFSPKKRLKIGTFKIESTGLRVGERFLKIIFDYAQKSMVDEIYVTLFENKRKEVEALMCLLMKWGFERYGVKKTNHEEELVLVKKMNVYQEDKDPMFNYPNLKENRKYGILPIDALYHTELFPDLFLKNEDMSLYEEKPCGYALEKVYVCAFRRIPLKPGDIMAIYRMSNMFYKSYSSVVSGVCVIQSVRVVDKYDEFLKICKNKTVFNNNELEDFFYNKFYHTIINVLFIKPLEKKIILKNLYDNNILEQDKGPRISTTITEEAFEKMLEMGGAKI